MNPSTISGQTIVVTRPRGQSEALCRLLRERGATVLEIPVIQIVPPTDPRDLADALLEINSYDWILFTSANGVAGFFDLFFKAFDDLRSIGGARIAAVGPATAERLRELHLKVDVMPKEAIAEKLAGALAAYQNVENVKMLLARAETATPELPKRLEEMGAIVDDVACYKTIPETADFNGASAALLETGADWLLFTSGSTVEQFHARFNLPQLLTRHPRLKIASIGPETTKAVAALGLKPEVEAKEHTIAGIVQGMEKRILKVK